MKKMYLKVVSILVIATVILNTVSISYAASSISSQKNELNQKIQETKDNLNEVNSQKEESQDKVNNLSSQIDSYESKINSLKSEIETKTNEVNELQKKLDELEAEREKNQSLLDERLVTLYESGEVSYLDMLLSSTDLTDFISSYYMIETLTAADKELIQNLENDKKEIADTQEKVNNSLGEIEKNKTELESVQQELSKAKNEEQTKVDKLTEQSHDLENDIEEYEKKMKELDAKEKAQEAALQKKYEEAKKKAEQGNSSGSNSNSGSSSGGSVSSKGFIRPVKTGKITAGMYYSSGKYHGAVDFGVSVGTPVYAAADGIVVTSTWGGSDSYGYYIKIKHYNGLYTLYAHGSSLVAKVGQEVKQGQLIMYSGNTGNSTGPHLHFEVRVAPGGYNNRVNPLNYLP
ncbi:MAG: peptidoglycan DD-metalloendopeptidase family protein [Clostridium sp.]|nr:peptidoglycan DD-metalloendopeptidase family protein [Clostridium sp.]